MKDFAGVKRAAGVLVKIREGIPVLIACWLARLDKNGKSASMTSCGRVEIGCRDADNI